MQKHSKWIWQKSDLNKDLYCEFFDTFEFNGEKAKIKISVDSNYGLYINGDFVELGQYPDFPHYKVYDEFEITNFLKKGTNKLAIVVWHFGNDVGHSSYYPGNAALRYEIYLDEKLVKYSSEQTKSRISRAFKNGYCSRLSGNIPYSYYYDMTKEDNWMLGELDGFNNSVIVDQDLPLYARPIKKLDIGKKPLETKIIKNNEHTIYDLGREETGYLTFTINSPIEQKILIGYSEHIDKGYVEHFVDCADRHFRFEFTLKKGENKYFNPFLRLGGRYLEVFADTPVEIEHLSILPAYYTVEKIPFTLEDKTEQKIYDISVRALELCMHEHYEDTPWREQALYALDSRNQMLCGYYCFKDYDFPRSNLLLMSKDRHPDGVLTITVPCKNTLLIPSFSLHHIIQTYEYTVHTGDTTLISQTIDKLTSILQVFIERIDGGLIPTFLGDKSWNYYEWSEGLSGKLEHCDDYKFETPLNCLLVIALKLMHKLNKMVDRKDNYLEMAKTLNKAIYKTFYDKKTEAFVNSNTDDRKSELVNALAILSGAVEGDEAVKLAKKLADENSGFTKISLSMIGFKYDALIKSCGNKFNQYIFEDIKRIYKPMLDDGATTVWETEDAKYSVAGSRCHGWSAMPVYYYHNLNKENKVPKYYED